MSEPKYVSIRVYEDTKEILDKIKAESWWVSFTTYDQKIKHLLHIYKNYKNNNHEL